MNVKKPSVEVLKFDKNDEECTYLIYGKDTKIVSSQESHNKGSSKLTLKNFVDFNWDQCYYRRQLIALNVTNEYIAYGFNKPDTSEGYVRVVKRDTNERALIKGFSFMIEDLRFAYLKEILMLACVDTLGTVHVYAINENTENKVNVHNIFKINEDPSCNFKDKHLLSWCQFIPEHLNCPKDFEYLATHNGKILAVARGSNVEIWHIGMAINFTSGPVYSNLDLNTVDQTVKNGIKNSLIKIDLKDFVAVDVSFSPNGSTVSIALNNGSIYFFGISFENDRTVPPQRVFTWDPPELSMCLKSMAFLDNRKQIDGDVEFWKYVVTFSDDSELILWSCETWESLQKLKFIRGPVTNNPMKLTIDETGRFIFLSDIDNNLLYVMEMALNSNSANKHIKISSITEILLQSPILNMIIIDFITNDANTLEQHNISNTMFDGLSKYNTVINLFAIQPKSIQIGQLIVSSPASTMTELNSNVNTFPKPPSIEHLIEGFTLLKNDKKELNTSKENAHQMLELSSMDLHNLVKEKLKEKGININKNVPSPTGSEIQIPSKMKKSFNDIQQTIVQPPKDDSWNAYDLPEVRDCSPSNKEVQSILHDPGLKMAFNIPLETPMENFSNNNYDCVSNHSMGMGDHSRTLYSSFDDSTVSAIKPPDKNETLNNGIGSQFDNIYAYLDDINGQLKCISKTQKTAADQWHLKIQNMIDQKLGAYQNNITTIIKNSNKVNIDSFTNTLVASLSPILDTILKDLFRSTVIPKFEQACCSMFKQIDSSFTERSLEYQNELKLLLNEEGNINNKLECAFDKFKSDMSGVIKHTEKNIISAQHDIQKQFSSLIKEKTLSTVESYVNDTESYANQLNALGHFLERGDYITSFEKALSASNLDLVLFVCEKVSPEQIFQPPYEFKTPIVLSLIQQLSHDLCSNTEIKYKYLVAAVGSLDYHNDVYKENIKFVLQKLEKNVKQHVQQFPEHVFAGKFKLLKGGVSNILNEDHF